MAENASAAGAFVRHPAFAAIGARQAVVIGQGVIDELVVLGDTASVTLLTDDSEEAPMTFNLPMHVVERPPLQSGEKVSVSLRGEGIHLMPPAMEGTDI